MSSWESLANGKRAVAVDWSMESSGPLSEIKFPNALRCGAVLRCSFLHLEINFHQKSTSLVTILPVNRPSTEHLCCSHWAMSALGAVNRDAFQIWMLHLSKNQKLSATMELQVSELYQSQENMEPLQMDQLIYTNKKVIHKSCHWTPTWDPWFG